MNNIRNKLITVRDVRSILMKANEELFDAKISNIDWYQRAFVHKSYSMKMEYENNEIYEELEGYGEVFKMKEELPEYESNERLEFLGDSIVDSIVKEYLYDRFDVQDEGFLTKLKIKLVRSERLAEFADYLEFSKYLLLSNKMENLTSRGENRGRNNKRFMEDCFEAFVGALMKDNEISGYYVAKKFILGLIEKLVDFSELILTNDNFKDSLLRLFQSRKWGDPRYTELYHEGVQTNRIFTKGVFLDINLVDTSTKKILMDYKNKNKITNVEGIKNLREMENKGMILMSIGKGKSKKEAEQNCGKWALTNLKVSWNY